MQTWSHATETYRFATEADLPAITEMLGDEEVGRWLWFTPIDVGGVEAYFGPLLEAQARAVEVGEDPDRAVFAVEDREGSFLGEGAVLAVNGSPGGFEIGYQLRRASWGRGVGTRLAQFLCAWAVHRLGAHRIEASCLEGNRASVAILEGLGFLLEGRRAGYRLKEGRRHTELLFGREVSDLPGDRFDGIVLVASRATRR